MSYRRAWLLIDDMNNFFREPVVTAQKGGTRGGGAALTPVGTRLIDQYRGIEAEAHAATAARLHELQLLAKRHGNLYPTVFHDAAPLLTRCREERQWTAYFRHGQPEFCVPASGDDVDDPAPRYRRDIARC
jgi:molybdate transport repressor ModE-like protein